MKRTALNHRRIGLALSGGGFRAKLFHLGVLRFLRDADLLTSVSHITAVSGGSVLAAHLALNWDRYNGSPEEFESAAGEVIRFVRMDVRNRIVRRLPLAFPIHVLRWLVRLPPARSLTRSGMLEKYYEQELYGQKCLYELPEFPELHLLATNLGEGALCSFTRDGVIMQKRLPGKLFHFERIHSGLGSVALAVAASSAFPGFFPPLLVHGEKIGAIESQFRNQLFTDGGIFDNLGVRMFRNIERSWAGDRLLQPHDFYDLQCVEQTLAGDADDADAITKRVRDLYRRAAGDANGQDVQRSLVAGLQQLVVKEHLYQDEVLGMLKPEDAEAETLLKSVQTSGHELNTRDRIWLNRQILETALRHATGTQCMRPNSSMFDAVLVSDAGKQFEPAAQARMQGLVTTALRASDILMDRVWQLESEAFTKQPGFVFISTTNIVSQKDDPHALHPEVQRQVSGIRTDLDRFTSLEISSLVQHGYCVARNRCLEVRSLGEFVPTDLPPWNPIPESTKRLEAKANAPLDVRQASSTTKTARILENSKSRRIWTRLFDWRDWVSYVYLPILAALLMIGPWMAFRFYDLHRTNSQRQALFNLIAEGSEDYRTISHLLELGSAPQFTPASVAVVDKFQPTDYRGFQFISETQVYDQRANQAQLSPGSHWRFYSSRRFRVARQDEGQALQVQFRIEGQHPAVHSPNAALTPKFRRLKQAPGNWSQWEAEFDLSRVQADKPIDLIIETESLRPHPAGESQQWSLAIEPPAKFGLISMWVLLPSRTRFTGYELVEREADDAQGTRRIQPSMGDTSSSGSILAWGLVNPAPGAIYECRWAQTYVPGLKESITSLGMTR